MICSNIGNIICEIRKEKNMTQKNIADILNISDKTISKWERGLGCPDVSLLPELSILLNVDIEKLLSGSLSENTVSSGNIKKTKFYVCPNCMSTMHSLGNINATCCGRKLTNLTPNPLNDEHAIEVTEIESEYLISLNHSMKKDHYISFIAYITFDKFIFTKLYPEQDSSIRVPRIGLGKIFAYCTKHGLFETTISKQKKS